jgi:hypothetical protein
MIVTNLGPDTYQFHKLPTRQVIITILGCISLSGTPGYESLMRVAGRIRLIRLSRGALVDLAAGLRAFLAELEDAHWKSQHDALKTYPNGEIRAHQLIVPLDEQHCAVIAVNYASEIILIEYAGLRSGLLRNPLHRRGARQ